MKKTKSNSSSKKTKDEDVNPVSTTKDPTKPDTEITYQKSHRIGDPIKKNINNN